MTCNRCDGSVAYLLQWAILWFSCYQFMCQSCWV